MVPLGFPRSSHGFPRGTLPEELCRLATEYAEVQALEEEEARVGPTTRPSGKPIGTLNPRGTLGNPREP